MIIDCIGCLHGALPQLDGGDLLIVTGDLTLSDRPGQWDDILAWLSRKKYSKKILIAGNHDNTFETAEKAFFDLIEKLGIDYLCDSGTEFEGIKIWGCPWTSRFMGINPKCCAFTFFDESWFFDEKLSKIPEETDILITHGPAYGILDGIPIDDGSLFHVGSKALFSYLKYVVRPRLHVFSHIHEAYGQIEYFPSHNDKMVISVNCSIMNERYKPVNEPVRLILSHEDFPRRC